MSYQSGLKTLRSLCASQSLLEWHKAKLVPAMFKQPELAPLEWVVNHVKLHHALPQIATLEAKFPDFASVQTVEPPSYYVSHLENEFYHGLINKANIDSQEVMKKNPEAFPKALEILNAATATITLHQHRHRIMDLGVEGGPLIIANYHAPASSVRSRLGWAYVDDQPGGITAGDLVSYVGRPAAGKTWLMLWTALKNWRDGNTTLFVSMEIALLAIAQRASALYAGAPISQLQAKGFASNTYKKFLSSMVEMKNEKAKFYVVDGNLAATVEDIYLIADMLQCTTIVIDGGYMVKNKNKDLNRFIRVAENVEDMKQRTSSLGVPTIVSWQFNREQAKKSKKSGKQETDLEDIGYSDAIGQISSIVLGMYQEEGIETMLKRSIRLMKGRNGEVGQFDINWDFMGMDFSQIVTPTELVPGQEYEEELQFV